MGKKYLFTYKVIYYDTYSDDYREKQKCHGITYADDYTEAMDNVMKYYGDLDIDRVRLVLADEAWSVLELPHPVIQKLNGDIKTND